MTTTTRLNDFPVTRGDVVTEGHARICRERGHATWTKDGAVLPTCPRCGDDLEPVHQRPSSCHVCGSPAVDGGRPACSHNWTNSEAFADAAEHDRLVRLARTPEAAYVAEHRPY